MSKREARARRLLALEQRRARALEVALAEVRRAEEAARVGLTRALEAEAAALACAGEVTSSADLEDASSRQRSLSQRVRRAREVLAARREEVVAAERALLQQRVAERRMEKLIERIVAAELARTRRVELRAADEHAARTARGRT